MRIKTLNVAKRRTCIDSLLCDEAIAAYDVLCLQELPVGWGARVVESYWQHWVPVFPSSFDRRSKTQSTRSCILVRTHIPSSSYIQIPINSLDITGLAFTSPSSEFFLFSLYNPCDSDDSILLLNSSLSSFSNPRRIVVLGDFNKHHPLWSGPLPRSRRSSDTESLLALLASFDLQLALPPGTATHRSGSTLDLAFVSTALTEAVASCHASFGHGSDHESVDLHLDFQFARVVEEARPMWRDVDWDVFRAYLAEAIRVADVLADGAVWDSPQALDDAFQTLLTILQEIAERCVPVAKPSPFSKRWWTRELTTMRRILGRLQRRAKKRRATEEEKEKAAAHGREYAKEIRHAKLEHWREWLDDATEQTIWTANRYVSQDGASTLR